MLPLKTAISDTYPNPSNAVARAGLGSFWDAVNEFQQKSELDVASAATCDIGAQLSTKLRITGTTGITSFGTNYRGPILLRFAGAVTLTHNATTLRCPGSANITTTAGDILIAYPTATTSGTLDGWQVAVLAREIPTAPTAAADTNTTQIATTAYVVGQAGTATPLTGAVSGSAGTSRRFAPIDHVHPMNFTSGTVQATTSGTSKDFTGIPSWVKRLTVIFSGVSTNSTSPVLIQIGDSGGIETTSYASTYCSIDSSATMYTEGSTTGFIIPGIPAVAIRSGVLTLTLADSSTNTWVASGSFKTSTTVAGYTGGDKSLSATLDRVRLTTANGTDTFDAGKINVFYE